MGVVARHVDTPEYASRRRDQELLTVAELAPRLRFARTTVYRLAIPYVLVGDRRRYRPEDVDAYLEARKVAAGSP